ncbi:unnamed protein product [Ilex paraguariensis]|uniref:Uncharacterized protein n=1 Tax=Ilex paraguariensis TaxID=185542 RepID=A0ABC8UA75_9AQUA
MSLANTGNGSSLLFSLSLFTSHTQTDRQRVIYTNPCRRQSARQNNHFKRLRFFAIATTTSNVIAATATTTTTTTTTTEFAAVTATANHKKIKSKRVSFLHQTYSPHVRRKF